MHVGMFYAKLACPFAVSRRILGECVYRVCRVYFTACSVLIHTPASSLWAPDAASVRFTCALHPQLVICRYNAHPWRNPGLHGDVGIAIALQVLMEQNVWMQCEHLPRFGDGRVIGLSDIESDR